MKAVAILVVLLALAGAWWLAGHPGYESEQQRAARVEVQAQAAEAAKRKLYRWRDAKGVTQITDQPPQGRKYEEVDLEAGEELNVIPMSEAIDPPEAAADKAKAK
jgi:hypothetical protein